MGDARKTDPGAELGAIAREAANFLRHARRRRLLTQPPAAAVPAVKQAATSANDSMEKVAAEVAACTLCRLSQSRTRAVPGEGPAPAGLMVIGEGPGRTEDAQGRPFVGEAGQMLTNMLERAVKLPRPLVFITNVVKCRPPNNRDPQPDEVAACRPYLDRQMALVNPSLVLLLGKVAAHNLLRTQAPISRLRGRTFREGGREYIPTFHPAYLLRNQADKALVNADLIKVRERLAELDGAGREGGVEG